MAGEEFSELLEEPKPGYPDPWSDLVLRLTGLRLLTAGDDPRIAQMHPIAHHVVRARIPDAAATQRQTALIRRAQGRADLLREAWIYHENRWEIEPLYRLTALSLEAESVETANLAEEVGGPLLGLGRLGECRDLRRRALSVQRNALDPDDPSLARSYSNLATVEADLGNPTEARDLLRRALAIEEKTFEPDHPKLATRYNNLAYVEADLDHWEEARQLMRRAYGICQLKLGEAHPHTQMSRGWLAEHDPDFPADG